MVLRRWLLGQLENKGINRIIAYESSEHLAQLYLELGGRVVNWLHFFELRISDLNMTLLDAWDDPSKLRQFKLRLAYFNTIPDHLLDEHARLHTELSNDIKRKDYSWEVVKTAAYTNNRQQLLKLQGKFAEIGYLTDPTGRLVGMTKVVFNPRARQKVYQTMTGITKNYRGKGLAKLLKANMMRRLLENYPAVHTVETDCLLGNEPMMSINEKMGFRRKLVPDEKEFILEKLFLHQNQKHI